MNIPLQRWSRYLIYFILATLPLERIPALDLNAGAAEITIRLSQVAGLLLIAINLPLLWDRRRQLLNPPWRWLALFLFVTLLSAGLAADPVEGLMVTAFTAFVAILARTLANRLEVSQLPVYGAVIAVSALTVTAFGFFQYFADLIGLPTSITGLRPHYTKAVFGFPRIQSTALEPLYFANYLLIPVALAGSHYVFTRRRRWWWLLLPLLTALWLTLSRGAFAGMAVLVLVLAAAAILLKHRRQLLGLIAAVALTITLAVGLIALGTAVDQKDTTAGESVKKFSRQTTNVGYGESSEGRTVTRRLAVRAFTEQPLLGIGPGNFGHYANQARPDKFTDTSAIVNNEPLEILAETGLLGALAFVLFALSLLWQAGRALLRAGPEPLAIWLVALLAALAATAVQYQTFSTLYITHIWAAIGLLAGLSSSRSARP
ncbi:O-antigen ligase family protein [Candidatus Parcubacteria bacterium]|nr:O-antigen ligase family protein [Candidatus Parcubacteria bacterium]